MTIQSTPIHVWKNPSAAASSFNGQPRQQGPSIYSENLGRFISLNSLADIPTDSLKLISNDTKIMVAEINSVITSEMQALSSYSCDQPMAIAKCKQKISALVRKKKNAKLIGVTATEIIKKRNREASKPRERLIKTQDDLNSFERLQLKHKYFKTKHFYALLRSNLGDELIDEIETKAANHAAKDFRSWADKNNPPQEFVNKILSDEKRTISDIGARQ